MGLVQSVCGAVGAEALGHCQIHEHIFVRWTPMAVQNPALKLDCFEASLRELKSYRASGGTSLVDAQPVAAGRDVSALERLSRESGVLIVGSTGYHLLGFYPQDCWIHALDGEELYALYRSEVEKGMLPWTEDGAQRPPRAGGIRAGMMKAAIPSEGPVGRYRVLLRAAARAAADTGTPLMLHTESGRHAGEALKLCFDAGLRPEKTVVCHVDRQAADFTPHDRIASSGVYLDYDTVGRFRYHSDEAEIALLRHMVEQGYGGRLLLSRDTTAARLKAYGGTIGLTYLLHEFLPLLRRSGFSEEETACFNRGNCQRLFSG